MQNNNNSPALIIFEGLDNTGKDTQINKLKDSILFYNPNFTFTEYHWQPPVGNTDEEKITYYSDLIKKQFELFKNESNPNNIHIWNRSHLGEYVYGQLYRNTEPDKWLFKLEQEILQDFQFSNKLNNIFLVHLDALAEHSIFIDDGFSYTVDPTEKNNERFLFFDAINLSIIPNKFTINVSANKTSFFDLNLIHHSIFTFLKYKNAPISFK
jgi:hypothetical protein